MKKGFFSHQLCYRRSLLNKHILYLTFDNKVDNILPFQREVSLTTFCEGVLFVVSQDTETNERLGRIKKAHFHGRMSTAEVYISKEQPSIADDASIKSAFYGAPTVVTLFAPKRFLYAESDACVAAENMLLAATSLGIGSCYIGSAWDSFDDPFGHEILQKWNVRTDYYAVLHILLGYPLDDMAAIKSKPRKEGRVLRVGTAPVCSSE